jgi:hypothetical protein
MSPILHEGTLSFAAFEARVVAEWKKAWREVEDWRGDPQPRVYLYSDWTGMLHMHEIPFEAFSSREAKDRFTAACILLITAGEVSKFAFCNSMMTFRMDEDHPEFEQSASDNSMPPFIEAAMAAVGADNLTELQRHRPDLILEMASIVLCDREVGIGQSAFVKRKKGQPPRLTEWRRGEAGGGLMFGPIQEALR